MNINHRYLTEPFHDYSDLDLLTIMIGGKQAQKVAQNLLTQFSTLKNIAQLEAKILARFPGIGRITATKIHAGLRAGRRALFIQQDTLHIRSPQDVYTLLWPYIGSKEHEELWVIYLNRSKKVLLFTPITKGNDRYTIVDPKQLYSKALMIQAAGLIMIHNHPSGDPTPSQQDIMVTQRVVQAGELLDIPLIDHIIIGGGNFCSLATLNLLQRK